MRVTTVADSEAAATRTAAVLVRLMDAARQERGSAHVALAGGSTPRRAYELLAPGLDGEGIELWFGDERCVAAEHPDSNYAMVSASLLAVADLPPERVHRIPGERGPEPAATHYAAELAHHLPATPRGTPVLDVALLGLGEDGHTASLFPGASALEARGTPCVGVHDAPKPPAERVTMTLEALGAARRCVLLATGAAKADAVAAVLAGPDARVPASLLPRGRLEVIVDDAAAPTSSRSAQTR